MNRTAQRNEEFVRRCIAHFDTCRRRGMDMPLDALVNFAVMTRPTAYFIDFDYASRELHHIMRHGASSKGNPLKRQMFEELLSKVQAAMERPRNLDFPGALTFVLTFDRPSRYWIKPDTARRLVRKHLTERKVTVRV